MTICTPWQLGPAVLAAHRPRCRGALQRHALCGHVMPGRPQTNIESLNWYIKEQETSSEQLSVRLSSNLATGFTLLINFRQCSQPELGCLFVLWWIQLWPINQVVLYSMRKKNQDSTWYMSINPVLGGWGTRLSRAVVVHICNPSTRETEAGMSLGLWEFEASPI